LALAACALLGAGTLRAQVVDPSTLNFIAYEGQPVLGPQTLRIYAGAGGLLRIPFEWVGAFGAPNFITISPSRAVTPTTLTVSLNPNVVPYMAPGRYSLDLDFVSTDPAQPIGFIATVVLIIQSAQPPVVTSVVNSASQQAVLSRGSLVSIYGNNLGTGPVAPAGSYSALPGNATATFSRQPLSFESLSNDFRGGSATANATTVTFNRLPAPLLYVSPTQINIVVPYAALPDGSGSVPVVVTHNGQASPPFPVPFAAASPALFTIAPNGRGQGAIQNVDSQTGAITMNSASNPAPKGSTIVLWGTGSGGWSQTPPDGVVITDVSTPPYYVVAFAASLTIGGQPAKILYAGAAPNQVSLLQVNAVVPNGIASGPQPVVLKIGTSDNALQAATVAVQ
jgi:uncharacterized protein (TIGR03437 family)